MLGGPTAGGGTPIDREKLLGLGYLPRGRTRNHVREGRRDDGVRVKATTDELGNTTTEHATKDDRVDIAVQPQAITFKARGAQ